MSRALKILPLCLLITCLTVHAAQHTAIPTTNLQFQIIENQLDLTSNDFNSLKLTKSADNRYGITINLTPAAATKFQQLTQNNIKKTANFVWHKHILVTAVIQSKLESNFLLTGFENKAQAEEFIRSFSAV
jgi:preprotein translocase subunit SecD